MMAMQFGMSESMYLDKSKMIYRDSYFVKSNEEFDESSRRFGAEGCSESLLEIVESCNVEIELNKMRYPHYKPSTADDYKQFLEWKNNA
jgi:DNA polymerase III alpha subunit